MSGFPRFNPGGNDANGAPALLPSIESDNHTSSAPPSSSRNLTSSASAVMSSTDPMDHERDKGNVLYQLSNVRPSKYVNDSIFNASSSDRNDSNGKRSGAPSPPTSLAHKKSGLPPFDPSTFRLRPSAPTLPAPGPGRAQMSEYPAQRSPFAVSSPFDPSEFLASPMAPALAPRCIEKCGPPFKPTKCWAPEPGSYMYGEKVSIISISFQNEYSRHSPEELRANYYEVGGKHMESTWVPVKTQSIKPFDFAANAASHFSKLGLITPGGAASTMAPSSFGSVVGGMDSVKKVDFGESLQENDSVFGVVSKPVETKKSPAQMSFMAGFEAARHIDLLDIENYDVSSIRDIDKDSKGSADSSIVRALKEKLNELRDGIQGQFLMDGLAKVEVAKKEFTENQVTQLMDTHPLFMKEMAKEVDARVGAEKHGVERGLLKRLAKANPNKTILEALKELMEAGVNSGDFTDDYDGDREDNPGL